MLPLSSLGGSGQRGVHAGDRSDRGLGSPWV